MSAQAPINVNVMHSDALITLGVTAILAPQADMQLSSYDMAGWGEVDADVIVTDYHTAVRMHECPQDYVRSAARFLIVTAFEKEWTVRHAMNIGVHGYVLQSCAPEELIRAVKALHQGRHFLSDAVAHCVVDSMKRGHLTCRETDVLQLLAKGYCNKTIASELGIGVGTVKTHVKGVLGKLNATARTHAVVLATQRGLVNNGAFNA